MVFEGNTTTAGFNEFQMKRDALQKSLESVWDAGRQADLARQLTNQITQNSETAQGYRSAKHEAANYNPAGALKNIATDNLKERAAEIDYNGSSLALLCEQQANNFQQTHYDFTNNTWDSKESEERFKGLTENAQNMTSISKFGNNYNKDFVDPTKSKFQRLQDMNLTLTHEEIVKHVGYDSEITGKNVDSALNYFKNDTSMEGQAIFRQVAEGKLSHKQIIKEIENLKQGKESIFTDWVNNSNDVITAAATAAGAVGANALATPVTVSESTVKMSALQDLSDLLSKDEAAKSVKAPTNVRTIVVSSIENSDSYKGMRKVQEIVTMPRRAVNTMFMARRGQATFKQQYNKNIVESKTKQVEKLEKKQEQLLNQLKGNDIDQTQRARLGRQFTKNKEKIENSRQQIKNSQDIVKTQTDKLNSLKEHQKAFNKKYDIKSRCSQRLTELRNSSHMLKAESVKKEVKQAVKETTKKALKKVLGEKKFNKMNEFRHMLLDKNNAFKKSCGNLVEKVVGKLASLKDAIVNAIFKLLIPVIAIVMFFYAIIVAPVALIAEILSSIANPVVLYEMYFEEDEENSPELLGPQGENAKYVYNYLTTYIKKNLPQAQDNQVKLMVYAIMGNIEVESSFSPFATNEDIGIHQGIVQWDENRLENFYDFCEENNLEIIMDENSYEDDSDVQAALDSLGGDTDAEKRNAYALRTQCEFITYELETNYSSVLTDMLNALEGAENTPTADPTYSRDGDTCYKNGDEINDQGHANSKLLYKAVEVWCKEYEICGNYDTEVKNRNGKAWMMLTNGYYDEEDKKLDNKVQVQGLAECDCGTMVEIKLNQTDWYFQAQSDNTLATVTGYEVECTDCEDARHRREAEEEYNRDHAMDNAAASITTT